MAIRRACSYSATIKTPKAPSSYSEILVTFQQNGINIINKTLEDLTIDGDAFIVQLTQPETAQFTDGKQAWVQMRCFVSDVEAPGSPVWPIDVFPALNDTILGGS